MIHYLVFQRTKSRGKQISRAGMTALVATPDRSVSMKSPSLTGDLCKICVYESESLWYTICVLV